MLITARATVTKPVSSGSLSVSLWASWQWLLLCKQHWCADSADVNLRGQVVTTPPSRPPPLPVNPIPTLSQPPRDRSCPPNPRRLLETCLSPLARFPRRRLLCQFLFQGRRKHQKIKYLNIRSASREQRMWLCSFEYSSGLLKQTV